MEQVKSGFGIEDKYMRYFVFDGIASNSTYNIDDELIKIETKSGLVKNITEIDGRVLCQQEPGGDLRANREPQCQGHNL